MSRRSCLNDSICRVKLVWKLGLNTTKMPFAWYLRHWYTIGGIPQNFLLAHTFKIHMNSFRPCSSFRLPFVENSRNDVYHWNQGRKYVNINSYFHLDTNMLKEHYLALIVIPFYITLPSFLSIKNCSTWNLSRQVADSLLPPCLYW